MTNNFIQLSALRILMIHAVSLFYNIYPFHFPPGGKGWTHSPLGLVGKRVVSVVIICDCLYSYLRASIGLRLAAFLAGYHPKKTPITKQTAKARTTDCVLTIASVDISDPASLARR